MSALGGVIGDSRRFPSGGAPLPNVVKSTITAVTLLSPVGVTIIAVTLVK